MYNNITQEKIVCAAEWYVEIPGFTCVYGDFIILWHKAKYRLRYVKHEWPIITFIVSFNIAITVACKRNRCNTLRLIE